MLLTSYQVFKVAFEMGFNDVFNACVMNSSEIELFSVLYPGVPPFTFVDAYLLGVDDGIMQVSA